MTQAGITVSWSMKPSDWLQIASIVQRAGIPAMVAFARKATETSRKPVLYATFFLRGGWKGLPPAAATPPQASDSPPLGPHCGHIDCHPDTRLREIEDADGLPLLVPCPDCHPAQGAHR